MVGKVTIAYHLGAPHTDDDQLTWSLRKDSALLTENATMLRRPGTYRKFINGMRRKLDGRAADPQEQKDILASLIGHQKVNRLILSDATILGMPNWIFANSVLYQNAGRNTAEFRNLFPENPVEFFLAIRNPATFVPETYKSQTERPYPKFMGKTDLFSIRWSDVIADIQHSNPGVPITVWCNEDTPIIWPTVLREVAGLDPKTRLAGELDVIRKIMSDAGIERLEAFLAARPHLNERQRRRVRGIVLEKYANSAEIETEINLPDWTEDLVEGISHVYEDDIDEISEMPGVRFLDM